MKKFLKILLLILLTNISLQAKPLVEGFWDSWRLEDSLDKVIAMPVDIYHAYAAEICVKDMQDFELQSTGAHKERMQKFIHLAHKKGAKVTMVLTNFSPFNQLIKGEKDVEAASRAFVAYIQEMHLDGLNFFINGPSEALHLAPILQKVKKNLPQIEFYFSTLFFEAAKEVLKSDPQLFSGIIFYPATTSKTTQEAIFDLHSLGVKKSQISLLMIPDDENLSSEKEWDSEMIEDRAIFVQQEGLRGISILSLNSDLKMLKECGFNISTTFHEAL